MYRQWIVMGLVALLIIIASCDDASEIGVNSDEDTEQDTQIVTIFAAASLTDAFDELILEFEAAHPLTDIEVNFAASSTLATQIIEGAEVDLFASANEAQMQRVVEAGLTEQIPQIFAENRIVAITHVDSDLQTLADLAEPGVLLIMAAEGVPIRDYTDQVIENFGGAADYGTVYTSGLAANMVSEEASVRSVVTKIALGEGDAGFVYISDVTPDMRDTLRVIVVPDELNVLATYPIVLLSESDAAGQFMQFVLSPEGQAILQKWGFAPAGTDPAAE